MHIAEGRITGWYYRVVRPGIIAPGDTITLVDRETERFSIDEFWRVQLAHRPAIDALVELIGVSGLAPEWKRRLGEREKWLRARL